MTSVRSPSIDSKSICLKRLIKQTSIGEVPVPSHITALLVPFFAAQNCLVLTPKSVRDTAESSIRFCRPTVHASPGSNGNFSDISDMRV